MTLGSYSGKIVLVTGSRKGIGLALAEHFLGEGATVLGLSRQPCDIDHANYHHYLCDVRDAKELHAVFQQIAKTSALHILINNSAVLDSQHAFMLTATSAEAMVATNLLGPFFVSREVAKIMKRTRWGRIINIGSMAAVLEPAGDSVYAATKAGLVTMTNVLARELSPFGITCNTVGVTAIESDMLNQLPRAAVENIIAGLPIPRYAEQDDIFNVVDFFSSERSAYITAQTIYLGGVHG